MKYELIRAYYNKERMSFVLDLFSYPNNKGVELHYYIGRYNKYKYDIKSIENILYYKRKTRELHTIEYWDSLINTIPNERGETK